MKTKKNGKPNLCLFIFVFFIGIFLFYPGDITGLRGEEPITGTQLEVRGVSLQIDPPQQTVPINTGTTVNTTFTVDMAEVPPGMSVKGELKGPGINGTMTLSTLPNHPFAIPGFPVKGTYTLENVRLEKDGKLLVHAVPDTARIDIRDVIITEVKIRLLNLDEIREKGIVVGDDNFKALNFSIGFQLDSEIKKFEFPMFYNSQGIIMPTIGGGVGGGGISLPGMNISGFSLEIPEIDLPGLPPDEESGRPQPIPGVLIFNNDVAFLNQFFSVIFIVSNNAPDNSPLTLENLTASITFPEGLREAETNPPHIPGTSIPVRCPGPDGKIGTADDLDIILATFSGMAEFLAEGLKEGSHIVKVDFAGTLSGLPIGDVPVKGSACGMVIVRNPEFSITFTHPSVVREGEEYDIFVTMTNTSPVAANLVSLTMPASRLVGTQLLGDEIVSFETIGSGESGTAAFHLLSLETGRVHASAFAAEGNLKGKFVLSAGVGEQGIPLSPDTLVLPDYTYSLPNSIINAVMLMLGEAYSIATTPPGGLPAHLPYIEKNIVENRAVELAEAGQRCQYGEDTVKSLQVLALDWQGNRQPNLPFDVLRRLTTKGIRFARAVAEIWNGKLTQSSPQDFHQQFAETCSYKNPFFSAVLSTHAAPRAAVLNIVDFYKNRLSVTPAGDEVTREIPYGELYLMEDAGQHPVDFALVGHPDENGYSVEVLGNDAGSFDLSLVLPGSSSGLRQVSFTAVSCAPGSISTLAYNQANDIYELINDLDGNGTPDSTVQGAVVPIVEPPLELIGAVQNCTADPAGHAVALLFNKTLDPQPVKNLENFFVLGKKIYATFLQPSGRVVLVGLNNAISPFVESRLRVSDLLDTSGGLLNQSPAEKPIIATIKTPGGIVYGQVLTADGQPIANARLQLSESESGDSLSNVTCSYVTTDSSGNYQFDYVRILKLPFILKVLDPTTGKTEQVQGKIQVNGQRFRLDIVMRGRGNIKGKVSTAQGAAVPKTYILADAENAAPLERFAAVSDDSGEFSFKDVPLGRVHLSAFQQNMTGYASTALSAPGETVTANITMMEGKTGTIRGRVLQNDAVTPVEAAYVILVKGGNRIRVQQTDARGCCEFDFAPVGDFTVEAINPATGQVGGQVKGQLSENQVVEAAIIFRGYGRITGKLMAHNGTPCANGLVFLQNTGCQAVTDSSGEFIIDDVPVGTYQMVGYNRDTYQKTYQMIELFEEGQEVRVTLVFADNQPGGISGRFYGEDGVTPTPGEDVYLAMNNRAIAKSRTDENGNFSFSDLAPGYYQVFCPPPGNAAYATAAILFPGQFVTRDITRRGRGKVIVNVFSDDGQTGIMSDVEFSQPVFRCVTGDIGFVNEKDTYNTDANGYTRFDNVYLGNFWVKAVNPFYPEDSGHWGELTYQGEQVTVNIVMKPTKKLTGRVVSVDNVTPVPNARVTLKFLYKYDRITPPPRTSYSDENAKFVFDLMPDGPFEVIAEDQISGYKGNIIGYMNLNDDTLDVTVRLRGRGTVVGMVKNQQEEAIPNADVTLESIGFPYETFETTGSSEGKFQFNRVSEGDFSIAVLDAVSGLAGRSTGKLQGNNSTVEVDVYLETSGTVTGKVWTPDMDQVVSNAQLVLFHQRDAYKAPFGFALSGADGSYRFQYIPVGSFYIEAFDPASGRKGKIRDTISSDAEIVQRDILLEGRGTVYGIFYDSTGTSPVPAASVKIKSSGLFPFELVSNTDSGGNFEFQQIAVGDFQLEAQDPASGLLGTASGTIAYDEQTVNTNIYAESSGTVKGKTLRTDGVTPVPHANVELVEIRTGKIHSTTANETGFFTISFVRSGKFSIKATDQASRDYGTLQAEITFNGQELNLDILFKGLGTVSGHVLDGSGSPLPDMEVKLNSSDYKLHLTAGTDGAGEFRFDGLPPDFYSLTARDPVTGLSGTGSADITANGQEVPVDLTLESAGQVSGTIFNADSTTPADKAQVKLMGSNFNLYTTADANGDFQFNTVRLGSFTLKVQGLNSTGLARAAGQLDSHGDSEHFDAIVLDNQPPAVVSVFPANGSSGVHLNTPVNIGFSEPMAPASITASSIKLSCAGVNVPGTRVLSGDKTSVLFTPNNPLTSFALYTITVGGSVEDLAGNTLGTPAAASFTTSDTQPPAVVSVSPVNNAKGIPIDAVITVTYNEPIDTTKFTLQNITLSAGSTPVTGSLAFNGSHTVVTFTPVQLISDTFYSLSVQGAVDMAGNIQSAAFSSGFSTTDTIAPVLQLLPPVGGTTVIEGSVVTVTADVGGAADIDAVYFFIEGQLKFTDKSALFNYQFTAPLIEVLGKTGFLLEVLAVDRAGNQSSREHLMFTLLQDQPPRVTLAGPADTTVYPGQSFNCAVTASDDVGLKQVILTAVGGSMNFNDTRDVSGTGFSRSYSVPVPADIQPGTSITLQARAVDLRDYQASAPAILLSVPQDSSAPRVSITSPSEGAHFRHTEVIQVNAQATDDLGIREVNFYLDEQLLFTDTAAPYGTNYTVPPLEQDKNVTFRAEAVDLSGKTADASVRVVLEKLVDETAPVVNILMPSAGSLVIAGEDIKFSAAATDDEGVKQVEFYVDDQLIFTGTAEPYETTYTIPIDAAAGSQMVLKAVAVDFDNKSNYDRSFVEVVTGTILTDGTVIHADDSSYDHRTIIIKQGTVTVNGAHTFENVLVKENGILTHSAANTTEVFRMDLTVTGKVVVGAGGMIDVKGCGYAGAYRNGNISPYGRTLGNTTEGGSNSYSGASYGGYGGKYQDYQVNEVYGSLYEPIDPGSGGGGTSTSTPGGSGGGVLQINTGALIVDGEILADGGGSAYRGAGSGGSIWITAVTLTGSGTIHANGGSGQYSTGSGGGGGRAAIYYQDAPGFDLARVTAYGGTNNYNYTAQNGSAGSVYLEKKGSAGELVINNRGLDTLNDTPLPGAGSGIITALEPYKLTDANATFTSGSLTGMKVIPNVQRSEVFTIISNTATEIYTDPADGDMTLVASVGDAYGLKYVGEVILENSQSHLHGSHNFGNLTLLNSTLTLDGAMKVDYLRLQSGSLLTHSPGSPNAVYSLKIDAGDIVIDESSRIDVKGCGYAGAYCNGNNSQYGCTLGNTTVGGSYMYSGASHGGYGGKSGNILVNEIYGSIYEPGDPGSGGGGTSTSSPGGSGGGVLRIRAGDMEVPGEISADGGDSNTTSGAGSGGSIWITVTNLTGSGSIHTNGGASSYHAGGGGGRIALYFENTPDFDLKKITSYGGLYTYTNAPTGNGSAGTVYLKKTGPEPSEEQLIIDNKGVQSYIPRIFPVINPAVITGLSSHVLENTNADYMTDSLVGMELIPNILKPEQTFTIAANSKTTITIDPADGDLTAAAVIGDTYSGKPVFPGHLIISNVPDAQMNRDVEVGSLDLVQNSSLSHPATLLEEVRYVSLKAAGKVLIDAASSIDVSQRGYRGANQDGNAGQYGRTLGNVNGSYNYSGGGYGGYGGKHSTDPVNETYGSLYYPFNAGSGGGSPNTSTKGGNGGGVLKIAAAELENNGFIAADGGGVTSSGAGSGGSIWLQLGTLKGTGTLRANGGNSTNNGGGGGGRIAVYYETLSGFNLSAITAYGGKNNYNYVNQNAGAGTIFLKEKTQTCGSLVIDNRGISNRENTTTLPPVGQGFNTLLEANKMVNINTAFIPGAFIGMKLNPQPTGNKVFTIISNTVSEIFTLAEDGDMTLYSQTGWDYIGEHHLFNLALKGNAHLFTLDRIQVTGTLTVEPGSTLKAENHQ